MFHNKQRRKDNISVFSREAISSETQVKYERLYYTSMVELKQNEIFFDSSSTFQHKDLNPGIHKHLNEYTE